jgi:tetratricopeptide (TPR) repeat protein
MIVCCFGLISQLITIQSNAQPNLSFEVIKPKQYENRVLPSEKTGNKKFTFPRRFYNNLTSRFNYYFNANNKLNQALDRAKESHKDDYTKLLSFYNYNLDETAAGQMDSVIYKCTAGILLHDLRSDWVDKLYLLMGKAYLYHKDFDSATYVFQYINYAFAPKDNGYDIPVGSNASNTNGVFTISTREPKTLWKRISSFPPSRNESFILQARTYIEEGEYAEAAGLLELIRTDPNFPERLRTDLNEMIAYNLYKQQQYEGAANYLVLALDNATNKQEKARWEYLAAQLYQLSKHEDKAIDYFEKSIQHATDPLLEVYARMNIVALASATQENAIQKNLDELLKMARRDKYEEYRNIIYYAAAQLELKRKNYTQARNLLLNSIRYSESDPLQKQLGFLLLGDMYYPIKNYSESHRFYDSIQTAMLKEEDAARVTERKPALAIISKNQETIHREDSLQKLATLAPDERNDYLKKLLKRLRREQGLKDADNNNVSFGGTNSSQPATAPTELFGNNGAVFYFQNASVKAKGLSDFKKQWGNRPNVDNWRRQEAVNTTTTTTITAAPTAEKTTGGAAKATAEKELSMDNLLKNIPLTPAQKDSSDQLIITSLLNNAMVFQNQLEDFPSAIEMYEEILNRYPQAKEKQQALFNLTYCYKKNGEPDKSEAAASQLKALYPSGKFTTELSNAGKKDQKADAAEQAYANVYSLFLSGSFAEAREAKIKADQQFGKNYWTPQLLYIESIYYIRQKEDSTAINRLENIITMFGKSPLAEKAGTMIDVLRRRKEIETYLTNLELNNTGELSTRRVDLNSATTVLAGNNRAPDSAVHVPKQINAKAKELIDISDTKTITASAAPRKDSLANPSIPKELKPTELNNMVKAAPVDNKNFSFNPSDTQYVVVILNKVDPIFVTESRNAFNRFNQDNYYDQHIVVYNRKLNDQYNLLLFGPFANAKDAMTYIDRVSPLSKTRIMPWLTTDKYRFSMISNANMNILINTQDMEGYQNFMKQVFPDKF